METETFLLNDCWITPEGDIIYVGLCGRLFLHLLNF